MPHVFLSHSSFDADLALYLKKELERIFSDIEVFVSSDPTDLPPGVKWPKEIQKALENAKVLLILATNRSLARPWIWFEAGTFWLTDKSIIPICLGKVRKGDLPAPLRDLEAIDGDNPDDVRNLLNTIAALGLSKTSEPVDELSRRLAELDHEADSASAQEIAGWIGIPWDQNFLAYEGPLEGLQLIEDEVYQQAMGDAFSAAGYNHRLGRPDRFSAHYDRGYRIIYLTDRKSWRRKISQNDLVLLARPAVAAPLTAC